MPVVAGPPQAHGPSTFDKSEFNFGALRRSSKLMANWFAVKMGALMGSSMSILVFVGRFESVLCS